MLFSDITHIGTAWRVSESVPMHSYISKCQNTLFPKQNIWPRADETKIYCENESKILIKDYST